MDALDWYIGLVVAVLAVLTVLVCVACVVVGGKAQERFDRHATDALDLIKADDRHTRLEANANGTGWY